MSRVGRPASWRASSRSTASASAGSVVTSTGRASGSCSAWARRSAATTSGSAVAVGENHELGRARQHVDADVARHHLLGRGDPAIAGPYHHVAGWRAADAVGQGRDGVSAAGGEQPVGPGHRGGGEGDRRGIR